MFILVILYGFMVAPREFHLASVSLGHGWLSRATARPSHLQDYPLRGLEHCSHHPIGLCFDTKRMQFEILKGFCLRVALILTPILTQALTRVINKEELKPKHVIGGTLVSARIALASI